MRNGCLILIVVANLDLFPVLREQFGESGLVISAKRCTLPVNIF